MYMKSFGSKPWLLPQPVLIIGTYDENGNPNAMNAAWGGQWESNEITIGLGVHATTKNLDREGVFTVAFATVETMIAADYVGIVSAKKEPNKIQKTGWTAVKAEHVNAPVFTDFPITMECRISRKHEVTEDSYHIVGEIVNILVDEKFLDEEGKPDIQKMNLISFDPIGHNYVRLGEKVGNAFSDGRKLK